LTSGRSGGYDGREKSTDDIREEIPMNTYEVTYDLKGEIRSELVSAPTPSEAARLFREQNPEKNAVVLCVVRQ
jgi:hypothetical protein